MNRTTIVLPPLLRQRLMFAAQRKHQSLSSAIRELLDRALSVEEDQSVDNIYQAMEGIKGIARSGRADASASIDELLYGENGAWRGWRGDEE